MIIELVYLFSGLVFMGICWVVAKRQVDRPIRFRERDIFFLHRYLFSPASFSEATSGVVGSTISFYITMFTSFCLSFGWGSILICVLVPSISISFLLFYGLVARVIGERFGDADAVNRRTADESVTFMDYLLRHHGSWFGALFCVFLMVLYIVATVSTEMDSLQILYEHIARNPADIIQHLPLGQNYKFALAILLCSLGYVLRGGYPGIMKIDRLQVALISGVSFCALIWIVIYLHPMDIIRDEFLFSNHALDITILGTASLLLIVTWISAALDNWLRVCGSMVDRIKDDNRARSATLVRKSALKSLRKSMITATLLATLISVVPAFLGLQLRKTAIDIWDHHTVNPCTNAQAHNPPVLSPPGWTPDSFLERYLSSRFVLVPASCGEWMAPNTHNPGELRHFSEFTSSVYDFFSLFLADRWVDEVENGSVWWVKSFWLVISGLLAVSVICAVITTVNSYLLCTSQLVYRLVTLSPGGSKRFRVRTGDRDAPGWKRLLKAAGDWVMLPLGSTLLVSLPIAFLVQSEMLTEENYISYGILAFCNIVYLAMIAAISVLGKDAGRVNRCMRWLFASWIVVILLWFVHMFAEAGTLPRDIQSSWIASWLAPRSVVVLIAAAANIIVWFGNYLIEPAIGVIRRNVVGRRNDE